MTNALDEFPPSSVAAQARLAEFAPLAGQAYALRRNFDHGPGQHGGVSTLSPYLRLRMLDEISVSRAVLEHHSTRDADKFLAEIFWRTYWKGWLELRPSVWEAYLHDLNRLQNEVQTQSGLRQRWEAACIGKTGIAPFDAWANELATTGYLHNHARMWFASIWIFTLGLPWQLGADFFLRHLLDGDVAVNTLSWRWVAGIQTRGKSYLATEENISKFTQSRFGQVPGLASDAPAQPYETTPPAGHLPPISPRAAEGSFALLLHSDDIDAARLLAGRKAPAAVAYLEATSGHSPWRMAPHVADFRQHSARDQLGPDGPMTILSDAAQMRRWAAELGVAQIVTPYAPVGPVRDVLDGYETAKVGPPLSLHRRPLDSAAWPLATKGFFPFRKHIPDLIRDFVTA